jgi:hypothetical protein
VGVRGGMATAIESSSLGSALLQPNRLQYRPVNNATRVGEQTGAT